MSVTLPHDLTDSVQEQREPRHQRGLGLGFILASLGIGLPLLLHSLFGISYATVATSSMEPALSPGDLEVVRSISAAELAVGDIVLLKEANSANTFSHRIITIAKDGTDLVIQTRGDANPVNDITVARLKSNSEVERPMFIVPKLGLVLAAFSTLEARKWIFALVLTSGALLLLELWRNHKKESRNDSDEVSNSEA